MDDSDDEQPVIIILSLYKIEKEIKMKKTKIYYKDQNPIFLE